jgi:hypothetical protein
VSDAERLQAARAAKEKARKLFPKLAHVTGVGITRRKGVYCVKINLAEEPPPELELPEVIDDVPVVLHVTGSVRKQD